MKIKDIKMQKLSQVIQMSPNAITSVLIRRRERKISGRRERGYVIEAES